MNKKIYKLNKKSSARHIFYDCKLTTGKDTPLWEMVVRNWNFEGFVKSSASVEEH